jgi:hypothetical protein
MFQDRVLQVGYSPRKEDKRRSCGSGDKTNCLVFAIKVDLTRNKPDCLAQS